MGITSRSKISPSGQWVQYPEGVPSRIWDCFPFVKLQQNGQVVKDIRFTGEPRDGEEAFKQIDLKIYAKRVFSMYGGEQRLVEIRFINPLLDAVVDRFGTKDVQYAKVDATHFSVTAKVEISDQFFGWILGFGKKAKLLYPDDVIDQFRDYMDKIREMYED